jgi:hypothetical protein
MPDPSKRERKGMALNVQRYAVHHHKGQLTIEEVIEALTRQGRVGR